VQTTRYQHPATHQFFWGPFKYSSKLGDHGQLSSICKTITQRANETNQTRRKHPLSPYENIAAAPAAVIARLIEMEEAAELS